MRGGFAAKVTILGEVLLNDKLLNSFIFFISFCLLTKTAFAAANKDKSYMADNERQKVTFPDSLKYFNDWPAEKKVTALNITAAGAAALIGAGSWDYCSSSFHFSDEGWFDPDTKFGGADKLGHAYSGYVFTDIYSSIYKRWGYSDDKALLGGVLSSWFQMTLIEFGDGFSREYGFSWEDELMDTLGIGLAYLRNRYPSLKDKFDFRVEWFPSPALRHGDRTVFTDYSGQKYLIALKPDGFLKTDNSLIKAVEFDFGYYSRGYDENNRYFNGEKRYTFFGVGLNMTYILEQLTGNRFGGIFEYVQIPFTYIPFSNKLD